MAAWTTNQLNPAHAWTPNETCCGKGAFLRFVEFSRAGRILALIFADYNNSTATFAHAIIL